MAPVATSLVAPLSSVSNVTFRKARHPGLSRLDQPRQTATDPLEHPPKGLFWAIVVYWFPSSRGLHPVLP